MASVQELLLAAQAKKGPLTHLLEGFGGGFLDARRNAFERERNRLLNEKMIQDMEQQKREQEQKMRAQQQMQQMIFTDQENQRKRDAAAVSGQPEPVFPQSKLEWSMGKDGDYTISKAKDTPNYGTDIYGQDANGNPVIIGRSNARNRPAYFPDAKTPSAGGGKGWRPTAASEKERLAVEAVTSALKNGYVPDPNMPGRVKQIKNYEEAIGHVVASGLDQDKYPEIKNLLANYEGMGAKIVEKRSPFGDLMRSVAGGVGRMLGGDQNKNAMIEFNSVQEAEKANLPKGTRIRVKGRNAVIQ